MSSKIYDLEFFFDSEKEILNIIGNGLNKVSTRNSDLNKKSEDIKGNENETKIEISEKIIDLTSKKEKLEGYIKFLENIKERTTLIDTDFGLLNEDDHKKIVRIEQFNLESSKLVNQQKALVDLYSDLKGNIDYYSKLYSLEKEISLIKPELQFIYSFENELQRILGEVMDGLIFFENKESYKNRNRYLEGYSKLKKQLLVFIKTLFIKLFSKFSRDEEDYIKNNLSVAFDKQNDVDYIINLIKPTIQVMYQTNQINSIKLNQGLKSLLPYIVRNCKYENDFNLFFNEVFDSFYTYYRGNMSMDLFSKFDAKLSMNFFLQALILLLLNEHLALISFFPTEITKDFRKTFFIGITENVIGVFKNKISLINTLDDSLSNIKEIDEYKLNSKETIEKFLKKLIDSSKQEIQKSESYSDMLEAFNEFLDSIREESIQRFLRLSQKEFNQKIVYFDMKGYLKTVNKQIDIYNSEVQNRRDEIFPPLLDAIDIMRKTRKIAQEEFFKSLSIEICTTITNMLYTVADFHTNKLDSYLFLIKHLTAFSNVLEELGIILQVTEERLDFSDSKNALFDILAGNVDFQRTIDSPFSFANNLLNVLYKGMPKLNEFTVDINKNIERLIKGISKKFVSDMSFIIGKNLWDFFRNYHSIKDNLEKNSDNNLQEKLGKFLEKNFLSKIYNSFLENLNQGFDEIIGKANNYFSKENNHKIMKLIELLQEDLLILLQNFYIIVSSKYKDEKYEKFKFLKIEDFKITMKKKIVYLE